MLLLPLLFTACLQTEVRELPADDVMASVRPVLGTGALAAVHEGVRVSGTCRQYGVEGNFDLLFDRDGRVRHAVRTSLGETFGFDGETAWGRDAGGVVRRLSFGARVTSLAWLWVQTGRWAKAGGPFDVVRLEGYGAAEGEVALGLSLRGEPWEGVLLVDRESFLPRELVHRRPAGERRYRFSDWTNALGLRYPGVVEIVGVAGDVSRFEADEIARAPTFVRSPWEPVLQRPTDTLFDASQPDGLAARRAPTGHLLVHPTLGGKDLGWFILDSGAGALCVDPRAAERAEMTAFGEVTVVGAGGASRGRFRRGARLRAGRLTLPDLPWLELETHSLDRALGAPVAGVLGYELFARAAIDVDLEAGRVALSDPAELGAPFDPARWLPLRFDDRIPCVQASFEGERSGWFRLDTGSDDSVIFHSPAVARLGLLEGRETVAATHAGVGGEAAARRGKLARFELAGERFEGLEVTFSTATESGLATPYTTGTLGGALLSRFRLVFDYGGERVALLPRGK